MAYEGNDRRKTPEPERWHVSKAIGVANITATLAMMLTALMWVTDMKRDLMVKDAQHEARFDSIEKRQLDDRVRNASDRAEIRQELAAINSKLDQMMQRRP